MKNKYIIINKDGNEFDPFLYIKKEECSKSFAKFVYIEIVENKIRSDIKSQNYLKYAKKLGFNWEPSADIGIIQYNHKAWLIIRLIMEYARMLVKKIGFPIYEIRGANIWNMSHPVIESYAKLYGDRLYNFISGKRKVLMSYDSSYPHFNIASKLKLNVKNLPFAHFSISDCYRQEQSGEIMMLYRLRRFFMPDLHPYFRNVKEAFKWYPKIENQIEKAAREVNREYHLMSEISSLKAWENYKEELKNIARKRGKEMLISIRNDKQDRYWIINNDYKIIDSFGQSREIACIQIDVGNAKRLNIHFKDKYNNLKHPVIIHSAVPGGIERFLYLLIDNFDKSFPLWLHPIQIRLIPVSIKYVNECKKIVYKNRKKARIDIDDRSESVSKRVKRAKDDLIPFCLVFGEKEKQGQGNFYKLKEALMDIKNNSLNKPFLGPSWPILLSNQVK